MDNSIVCDIRCPIHGFIGLSAWEKSIIDTSAFQRLRRIKQLAWTDFVYPGAMHNRFEHSLGVMHVATLLFDAIRKNSEQVLKNTYKYDDHGLARDRQKVRLAALLHDVGHPPFSHGSEELFPFKPMATVEGSQQLELDNLEEPKSRYKHEEYSYALIRHEFQSCIEDHDSNRNYRITANEIADLLQGKAEAGASLLWKDILDNQLDADRMDYLLRDSYHLGVNYGVYDLRRLVGSVCAYESASKDSTARSVRIGVLSGGLHAAESLVMARYWMFKQVYQHKTRIAFDIHLKGAMIALLSPATSFPIPEPQNLSEYLSWDDWKVQGMLASGLGGEHAKRLLNRQQWRQVYRSEDRLSDVTDPAERYKAYLAEIENFNSIVQALGPLEVMSIPASNTWYKVEKAISIVNENDHSDVRALSEVSPIQSLNTFDQHLIYADPNVAEEARSIASDMDKKFRERRRAAKLQSGQIADPTSSSTGKKEDMSIPNLKLVAGKEEANGR